MMFLAAYSRMIDLKESDVAPIVAQLCRDINKDFDSISGRQLETGKRDGWRIEVKFSESI